MHHTYTYEFKYMHIHTVCKSDFSLLGQCICVCIVCILYVFMLTYFNPYVHVLYVLYVCACMLYVWYVLGEASTECISVCIVCIVYVSFSIHMCMYCMYCMYAHVCCMYRMYWPRQARVPAQRPQKPPRWGGTPRAPLRAPLGRWQTTFLCHWGPTPGPVLAHPRAQHALVGPKCTPCAADRHSTRISRSASPARAPSKMIWVDSSVQRRRVQPPLPHKNTSRP